MEGQLRLTPVPEGPHCGDCILRTLCGSEQNENTCPVKLDLRGRAGPHYLHPLRSDFVAQFEAVGGGHFDDIVGRPVALPQLARYVPQVHWGSSFADEKITVEEMPFVAVRVDDVFSHDRIRTADEVRAKAGLPAETQIILLLHGRDSQLEKFASVDRAEEVAAAGYALVTPPSFSLWEPQRRPNNLMSLRRRAIIYGELVNAGVAVCPSVGWVEAIDAERLALWVKSFGGTIVALDLMTYSVVSFQRFVEGLAYFDAVSGEDLHFLIDGVCSVEHIEKLYLATSPERVTITNATIGPPPERFDGARTLRARTTVVANRCEHARLNVAEADENTVDQFIERLLARSNRIRSIAA